VKIEQINVAVKVLFIALSNIKILGKLFA